MAFRRRGKTVVLGGVHPTYCPEKPFAIATPIVCGEAEDLWPQVVADFEAGHVKRHVSDGTFSGAGALSIPSHPTPQPGLLHDPGIVPSPRAAAILIASFAACRPSTGRPPDRRPVPEVIQEMQHVKEWLRSEIVERMSTGSLWNAVKTSAKIWVGLEEGSIVAFVDDLHNSHRAYCRELWQAMKALNIKWGCQSTLFLGDDQEMVKLAAESGCVSVFVGMESISDDSLGRNEQRVQSGQKI